LLIPATVLQAVAATGSGRAAARFGDRTVLITGLALLLAGLVVLTLLGEDTPLLVLFAAIALNAIGGAVVQTPQATIMMASAPADLGGAVSAVKSAVGQAGYSLGPALFGVVATMLFVRDASGITVQESQDAFRVAHGGAAASLGGARVLDPDQARQIVEGSKDAMLHAIHTLSWIMAVVPAAAIVVALVLLRRPPVAGAEPFKPSSGQANS
jgi:MFS family permease